MPDPVVEVLKGIRCYFDKALPVMLLYKKERKQYQEAVTDDVSPSVIYGGEHLLRLFGMLILSVGAINMHIVMIFLLTRSPCQKNDLTLHLICIAVALPNYEIIGFGHLFYRILLLLAPVVFIT